MRDSNKQQKYFYGQKISDYGIEHSKVDYAALAGSFQHVLCNNLLQDYDNLELVNGTEYNEETENYIDVFQAYIISDAGKEILCNYTNELVYYHEKLDVYVWGVTHCGTCWTNVLTNIDCQEVNRK